VRNPLLAAFVALTLGGGSASADFVVTYDFSSDPVTNQPQPGPQDTPPNPQPPGSTITASDITRSLGLVPALDTTGNGSMNSSNWSTTATLDPSTTSYYTLTITADPGLALNLTSFSFGNQTSPDGPTQFSIRTSLDGFASDVFTYSLSDSNIHDEGFTFGPEFTDTNLNSIEIRIYGFNAGSPDGTYSLNDGIGEGGGGLMIAGDTHPATTTTVPVPASAVMLLTGAPALLLLRRRLAG
jgi:hypothetical protein